MNKYWYLAWWLVSLIFAVSYFIQMRSGEPSQKNMIIFIVWLSLSVVGLAFFLREMVQKKSDRK